MRSPALILVTAVFISALAFGQTDAPQAPPPGAHRGMGMRDGQFNGVAGTITELTKDGFTLKSMSGDTAKIKVSSETRFRRDREEAKLSDFKVGELVLVGGEQDKSGVWNARFVAMRSDLGAGGMHGGRMGIERPNPADMGKTFILGQLTKIEETKLTIHRPDGVDQVIEVDESTSFHNARGESITLADFKVGDRVGGRGAIKNGIFVPTEFRQAPARMGQGMGPGGPPRDAMRPPADGSTPPPPPPPNSGDNAPKD